MLVTRTGSRGRLTVWYIKPGKVEAREETVLTVYIGSGKGNCSEQIREVLGGVKGRVVLQDLPSVMEKVEGW